MNWQPQLFPVSIKGVLIRDSRVLLLRNERGEWELPGGKLELGEEPEVCLAREIAEEIGWEGRSARSSTPGCTTSAMGRTSWS